MTNPIIPPIIGIPWGKLGSGPGCIAATGGAGAAVAAAVAAASKDAACFLAASSSSGIVHLDSFVAAL